MLKRYHKNKTTTKTKTNFQPNRWNVRRQQVKRLRDVTLVNDAKRRSCTEARPIQRFRQPFKIALRCEKIL